METNTAISRLRTPLRLGSSVRKGSLNEVSPSGGEDDGSNEGKLGSNAPINEYTSHTTTVLSPKVTKSMSAHAASFLAAINTVYYDLETLIRGEAAQPALKDEEKECLGLSVPPILALYGLIERKWVPKSTEIDDGVIECLGFVLSSLHAVTVAGKKKSKSSRQ